MSAMRSPRAKMAYVKELDALVQEDLLPDMGLQSATPSDVGTDIAGTSTLCCDKECAPPYGDKDDCEFYLNGRCTALESIKQLAIKE